MSTAGVGFVLIVGPCPVEPNEVVDECGDGVAERDDVVDENEDDEAVLLPVLVRRGV